LQDKRVYTPNPQWYIYHPDTREEAQQIYDSINSRLGHDHNRASRAMLDPDDQLLEMWAFDGNWAKNMRNYQALEEQGWKPHEEDGIWH